MNEPTPLRRFVTIKHFVTVMLGLKHVQWYYDHQHDEDMPQRVYFGSKPMLLEDECLRYVEKQVAARDRAADALVFIETSKTVRS